MIKTVADFLSALAKAETSKLAETGITQPPRFSHANVDIIPNGMMIPKTSQLSAKC